IQFCGAAQTVTGSCHLISTDKYKFLLDCGQFQGSDTEDQWNYSFDFNPAEIDFVLLSHAHIDHSGRLPLLVKKGFKGKIYCTAATADLLQIMLLDSGYIHEKEAEWDNKKNERLGRPLREPLYTVADAQASLTHVVPVLYDQLLEVNDQVKAVFNDAGHILGSAIIEVFTNVDGDESKLVFSGDLGVKNKPILRDPTIIKKADFLILETTYGDRVHTQSEASVETLIDIILRTARRGGNTIIPSFAVGRTQELIYELNRFYEAHSELREELNRIMVYVDSPLAISATEVFQRNASVFDDETREYILKGDNPLDFKNLRFTRKSNESRALNDDPSPKVIIAASGMCEAGRIKHHLKHNLWNAKASIVFVGYQAVGTLGRSILDGCEDVSIFGERIHVSAEIHNLSGFSGHADREGLLNWLGGFQKEPYQIFLVHGELEAKNAFAESVKNCFGYDCIVVQGVSEYELIKDLAASHEPVSQRMADREAINRLKENISAIRIDLEDLLYKANLAVDAELTPEQMEQINRVVLSMEKNTVDLGMALTHQYQK
ncbi:MAG TPA: MBL fold metallo-hydrolase, partial [Clostridiales bacterium]|nr:MBL fold metallo-hydrolase [Clostridiales bacterium]